MAHPFQTGDIEDIHHKSGGGVTTVYGDTSAANNNEQLEMKRFSNGAPAGGNRLG